MPSPDRITIPMDIEYIDLLKSRSEKHDIARGKLISCFLALPEEEIDSIVTRMLPVLVGNKQAALQKKREEREQARKDQKAKQKQAMEALKPMSPRANKRNARGFQRKRRAKMSDFSEFEREIIGDILFEEELEELAAIKDPSACSRVNIRRAGCFRRRSYVPAPIKITQATDEELSALVADITAAYPDLVDVSLGAHWSLSLIAILQTIDYLPRRGMVWDRKHFKGLDRVGFIGYVNGHISNLALKDIRENVDIWIKEHPIMPTPKVEIMETEGGGLAYQATQVQIEKSESATQEGWASW